MKVIDLSISELKPYPKNARIHPQKQVDLLAKNIQKFGFTTPVLISENNEVIAGHGRLLALKQLGKKKVPCVKMEGLTEEEVRALRLADNQIASMGEWDMDLAIPELRGLGEEAQELTGFDLDILKDLEEDDFDAQAEYDKITQPNAKLGDLYVLGEHKLYVGDSTKEESYEKLMGGEKADMIFTDPPYNVGYSYNVIYASKKRIVGRGVFNDKKKPEEFEDFIYEVMDNANKYTNDNSCFYLWLASKQENYVRSGIERDNWYISQTIIWLKERLQFSPGQDYHRMYEPCYFGWKNRKGRHFCNKKIGGKFTELLLLKKDSFEEMLDVWYQSRDLSKNYIHPTQKPIRLAERALKYHSNPKGIILEPFNGSGSTMMACEQMGRRCRAIELDPKFVDVAIKRYEEYTGNKATKL